VLDVSQCPNGPPEQSAGVVTDVVALLNKFSNVACAIRKTRADLVRCRIDFNINTTDVVGALSAFTGGDDENTCGTGQCGPAGLCKGGADHGTACLSDGDCRSDRCVSRW